MSALCDIIQNVRSRLDSRAALTIMLLLHSAVTCLSLIKVATWQSYIHFSGERVWMAVGIAAAFSVVSLLFAAARFSFGYFVGFYFYTMILGFLWIDVFSEYSYERLLAGCSAAFSLVLFLLPVLFVRAPFPQRIVLSNAAFEHLLTAILAISIGTIAVASTYNFRMVAVADIYDYRGALQFPGVVRYLVGWVSSTLLPFAFACYWLLGYRWRAGLVLILLLFFYPITLTKFSFFTSAWLIVLAVLSRFLNARTSVITSLFVPMLLGVAAMALAGYVLHDPLSKYFDVVNIRMMATPSSALDIYNHFFASHPLTWFCQISVLKAVMSCAYQDQLSVVMQDTYGFGMPQRLPVRDGGCRLGRTLSCAADGTCVGFHPGSGQPCLGRTAATLRADIQRHAAARSAQYPAHGRHGDPRHRAPLPALVRGAAKHLCAARHR
ncbi:hypothetical protein ACVWZZ_001093 [Bradyrhizobium sp. LM6.10]